MITQFRLVGMSRPHSFTLLTKDDKITFWASGLTLEKFNELWDYCHNNWNENKFAEVGHDGLREDETPINPIVLGIIEP